MAAPSDHPAANAPSASRQLQDESQLPFYLTVEEFAKIARIGRSKAYSAVREGSVPQVKFGKLIRIPRSVLEAAV
jgi:excisionase family DNA binding protein